MGTIRFVFVVTIAALFLLIPARGQSSRSKEVERIDKYVRSVSRYIEKPSVKFDIYANVSTTEKPIWRKFRSEKSLEVFRESNEVYEIAFVWRQARKIVAVNFTFTSGSGDWAHYVFHRFRLDGTLARIEADLRTFYGHMSVERVFYYDTRGNRLQKRTRYRDLSTDKPKKPDDNFIDNQVTIYKTTKRLPFLL